MKAAKRSYTLYFEGFPNALNVPFLMWFGTDFSEPKDFPQVSHWLRGARGCCCLNCSLYIAGAVTGVALLLPHGFPTILRALFLPQEAPSTVLAALLAFSLVK